jgi:hypothetical protein
MTNTYKVRYLVEPWNKPPPENLGERVAPGIRVSNDNYGYTDVLFVGSVLLDGDGSYSSVALTSSEQTGTGMPSRKLLEAIKDQIEHMLEHHIKE